MNHVPYLGANRLRKSQGYPRSNCSGASESDVIAEFSLKKLANRTGVARTRDGSCHAVLSHNRKECRIRLRKARPSEAPSLSAVRTFG